MKKRLTALLLAFMMILSFAACGGKNGDANEENSPDGQVEEPGGNEETTPGGAPEDEPSGDPTPETEPSAPPAVNPEQPGTTTEPNSGSDKNESEASLSDIMSTILDGVENLPFTETYGLDEKNFEAYLFIPYIEGAEAVANEAAIGSIAHSVVLLRLPDGEDADTVAQSIENNADPRKWICVGAEETIVAVNGNLVILIMSFSDSASAISENFANYQ